MGNYTTLQNTLQSNIFQNSDNSITGQVLRDVLLQYITTLGIGSGFMGVLSASNKPTASVDGKQWYIGYNASSTNLVIDLTAVGCGTLTITRQKLYIVYADSSGWHAVNVSEGIGTLLTGLTDDMATRITYDDTYNLVGGLSCDAVRLNYNIDTDGQYVVINDIEYVSGMVVDGVAIEPKTTLELTAGDHNIDYVFTNTTSMLSHSLVPDAVFTNITEIKKAMFPDYILQIGLASFYGCTGLSEIALFGVQPPRVSSDSFTNAGLSGGMIYAPTIAYEQYRGSSWANLGATITDLAII